MYSLLLLHRSMQGRGYWN